MRHPAIESRGRAGERSNPQLRGLEPLTIEIVARSATCALGAIRDGTLQDVPIDPAGVFATVSPSLEIWVAMRSEA